MSAVGLDRAYFSPSFNLMDVSDNMTDSSSTADVRARRRKLHTEAEQRRRDAIKVWTLLYLTF